MKREHLKIFSQPSVALSQNSAQLQHSWEGSAVDPDTFTSMLTNLIHSRRMAVTARAVGECYWPCLGVWWWGFHGGGLVV